MAHANPGGWAIGFWSPGFSCLRWTTGRPDRRDSCRGFWPGRCGAQIRNVGRDASLAHLLPGVAGARVTIVSIKGTNIDLLHVLSAIIAMDDDVLVIAFTPTITLLVLAVDLSPLGIECVRNPVLLAR